MEIPIEKKHLIGVAYPGVVENVAKMIGTLGGEKNINQVFNTTGQRLELRFRPDDLYSKPTCANRHNVTNLVLKVRRRKKKPTTEEEAEDYEYEARIIGTMEHVYTFKNLADFQYLPMTRQEGSDSHVSLIQSINLQKTEKPDWVKKPCPLFLPPTIFSRIDNPTDYNYRDGPYKHTVASQNIEDKPNVISVYRQRRPHFTCTVTYENWTVPQGPLPQAVAKAQKIYKHPDILKNLRQLFEERPVWSRTAIHHNMSSGKDNLKHLLPGVAYYVVTGPWRRMWIRFGYDPKTNKEAKIYQVLDFRIKDKKLSTNLNITFKRSSTHYRLPNKMTKTITSIPRIHTESLVESTGWGDDLKKDGDKSKGSPYKFYPGVVPPYHQFCYQYCDIEEPEIQRLIHLNDGQETVCHEKDGWCIPGTCDKVRRIILAHLYKLIPQKPSTGTQDNLQEETDNQETNQLTAATLGELDESNSATLKALAESIEDMVEEEVEEYVSEEEEMMADDPPSSGEEFEEP